MNNRVINRWQAAAMHLVLSAIVAALVLSAIRFAWYPGALFSAAGGLKLFLLIAGVDVALGPLMTLVVFRQGKKGLRFDLATIAVLQLVALVYGTHVLYESRPAWIVFVVDRFELVRANRVLPDERKKARPPYNGLPVTGPRLVGAVTPKDPDEQLRIGLAALQGLDLQLYPQYYVPYADVAHQVAAHAKPLGALDRYNPGAAARISALPGKLGMRAEDLGFLPMRAGKSDLTVIVDRRTGAYLATEPLKPWQY